MRIIIAGGGKVGMTLAQRLSQEDHDLILIDTNSDLIEKALATYDIMGIVGHGASAQILKEAEADKADIFISTTDSDELNILSCLIAEKMGTQHTIARVRNPEYSKQLSFFKNELGLSMIVNPEFETANEIFRVLKFPTAIRLDVFCKGKVELAQIDIGENPLLDNLKLMDLPSKIGVRVIIGAVQRDNKVYIPKGDFVLKNNDIIHIAASHKDLSQFLKKVQLFKEKAGRVMIIGGSKIAYYLADLLQDTKISTTIIEIDKNRCLELSSLLPSSKIVLGDGTDQTLLIEEGLLQSDVFISLLGIDEENIILSMYADKLKIGKTIAKINNFALTELMGSLLTQSTVSPRGITADRILRYVRALQNTQGSTVNTLYRIIDKKVDTMEFVISQDNLPYLNKALKDLKFKKDVLVVCIIRYGKLIYPTGNDHIMCKDNVVVISPAQDYINDFADLLE